MRAPMARARCDCGKEHDRSDDKPAGEDRVSRDVDRLGLMGTSVRPLALLVDSRVLARAVTSKPFVRGLASHQFGAYVINYRPASMTLVRTAIGFTTLFRSATSVLFRRTVLTDDVFTSSPRHLHLWLHLGGYAGGPRTRQDGCSRPVSLTAALRGSGPGRP